MKNRLLLFVFGIAILGLLNLNYSSGPGTVLGNGYTGAPGDNNGCTGSGCHSDNDNFSSSVNLVLSDAAGPVTAYIPDSLYDFTITVSANGASAYGFQAVCLKIADQMDAAGWETTSANAKIVTASNNGRQYIEHTAASASNSFSCTWRAPATGFGDVNFYAAGNATNGANGNSGDDPTATVSLTITEDVNSGIKQTQALEVALNLFPNPTHEVLNLDFTEKLSATYQLEIVNVLGEVLIRQELNNPSQESIDVATLTAGIYFLRLTDGEKIMTKQFSKR